MKACRDCKHLVSEQAVACPNCGAAYPAKATWDGWGFEYIDKGYGQLVKSVSQVLAGF